MGIERHRQHVGAVGANPDKLLRLEEKMARLEREKAAIQEKIDTVRMDLNKEQAKDLPAQPHAGQPTTESVAGFLYHRFQCSFFVRGKEVNGQDSFVLYRGGCHQLRIERKGEAIIVRTIGKIASQHAFVVEIPLDSEATQTVSALANDQRILHNYRH